MSTKNIYCGAGKTPKGKTDGTFQECYDKNQIRKYGVKQVDEKKIHDLDTEKQIVKKAIAYNKKNNTFKPALEFHKMQQERFKRHKQEMETFYNKPKKEQDDIIKKHGADKEKLKKKKQTQEKQLTKAKNEKKEGDDLRIDFGKIDKIANMIDGRERKGIYYRVEPLVDKIKKTDSEIKSKEYYIQSLKNQQDKKQQRKEAVKKGAATREKKQ